MKTHNLRLGKRAISEELVRAILAAVILIIFLIAARSLIDTFLIGQDPKDVESEAMFLNLAEQVDSLLSDQDVYAVKDDVAMSLSDRYSIIAFNAYGADLNKDLTFAHPNSYMTHSLIQWDPYRTGDFWYKDIKNSNVRLDIKSFKRPLQCTGSCLCLVQRKKDFDKRLAVRLVDLETTSINDIYNWNSMQCKSFPANVRFYGYGSKRQYEAYDLGNRYSSDRRSPPNGEWLTLGYYFDGLNLGAKANWIDFGPITMLSQQAVSYQDSDASRAITAPYGTLSRAKFNERSSFYYSDIFLNDATSTIYKVPYWVHKYSMMIDLNPQAFDLRLSDILKYYNEMTRFKNQKLYLDKIDFGKIKSASAIKRDEIYIFIAVKDNGGALELRYNGDFTVAKVNENLKKAGVKKFDGQYSHLDLRKWGLYYMQSRDPDKYSRIIQSSEKNDSLMYFMEYFFYVNNALIFTPAEAQQIFNSLSTDALLRAQTLIEERLSRCKTDSCKTKYFDDCKWTSNELCMKIQADTNVQLSPTITLGIVQQAVNLKSSTDQNLALKLLEKDSERLLEEKKYFEILASFERFVEQNKDIFYDKDGDLMEFEKTLPRAAFLRDVLSIRQMLDNDEFNFHKSDETIFSNMAAFEMESDRITYTIVPEDAAIYDDDPYEQSEYGLGFYLEDFMDYDLKTKLFILKILEILKTKNCITVSNDLRLTASLDECEAENV